MTENEVARLLGKKISEDFDRSLFEEAVTCFEASALRASYIMTWISVAESLRNRFSSMADRGDGQAGKILKDMNQRERKNQTTDLYLLDQAKVLGLVTNQQHEKLGHLRNMRNHYAHPTDREPTKQETLAALEISVDALLSQPARLRHGYANYQLKALFSDPHWLPDDEQAVRENAAGVAHRLHPDAAPRLLEGLVEEYEKVFKDPEQDRVTRRAGWFLDGFLAETPPDLTEPRWNIVHLVLQRPVAATLMLGTPAALGLLPDQARGMVIGHLTEPTGNWSSTAKLLGLRCARALITSGILSPEERKSVNSRVKSASYHELQDAGVPLEIYVGKLLNDLRSHDWNSQNPAATALSNAGPEQVKALEFNEQEQLGRNVLQAADGPSRDSRRLINRIRHSPSAWPTYFVLGLLLETLVDDKSLFRLKGEYLSDALAIVLSQGTQGRAGEIVGLVAEKVRESNRKEASGYYHPGMGWFDEYDHYDKAVEILSRVASDDAPDENSLVVTLIDAVRSAKPPEESEEEESEGEKPRRNVRDA